MNNYKCALCRLFIFRFLAPPGKDVSVRSGDGDVARISALGSFLGLQVDGVVTVHLTKIGIGVPGEEGARLGDVL